LALPGRPQDRRAILRETRGKRKCQASSICMKCEPFCISR
jgi:hypothetical protein